VGTLKKAGGGVMFTGIGVMCGLWAVFSGAQRTADSLGRERRDGTLGLLFLTDLTGWDVVVGKLFAAGMATWFQLMAVVPVLTVPLLLGGVGGVQVGLMVVAILNGLILSLALGLTASLMARDPRQATGLAAVWLLGLASLPWGLFGLLTGLDDPWSSAEAAWVLLPSPTVPYGIAVGAGGGIRGEKGWAMVATVGFQMAMAMGVLWLTARRVRHVWQEGGRRGWRARWNDWVTRVRFGDGPTRKRWRDRWLEVGPWEWLSLRERWRPKLPWLLVVTHYGLVVWLGERLGWRDLCEGVSGLLSLIFHGLFTLWMAGEATMTLHEQQSIGAGELLLTTGMTPEQVLEGQGRALRTVLKWPLVAVVFLDGIFAVCPLASGMAFQSVVFGWWLHIGAAVSTPAIWQAMRWGSTRAVMGGQPLNTVVGRAVGRAVVFPGMVLCVTLGGAAAWLNLNYRIDYPQAMALGIGLPSALLTLWAWHSGRRDRAVVSGRFCAAS
jgi:hypothetical protein